MLPASVLIGNAGQQWLSTAIPLVLQQDLGTSASYVTSLVPNLSSAYQLGAAEVIRIEIQIHDGRYWMQATGTSLTSQQNTSVQHAEGSIQLGIISVVDALAHKLDSAGASRFSTRNEEALRIFTEAVTTADSAKRVQLLDASIQADPKFGLAQIARVENAPQVPDISSVPFDAFVPLDRVRWAALAARIRKEPLPEQADAEAKILRIAPNNAEALTTLGFDRFLQGRAAEGENLIRRAISLNPSNLALPLQLTQGLVAVKNFAGAVRTLTPLATSNANLLLPLSLVQLLNGKPTLADQTFRRFLSFLPAGDPAIVPLEAQWQRFLKPDPQAAPAETLDFWQTTVQRVGETNLGARAMLAAALDHAGRTGDARKLQVLPFIPEFNEPNAPIAFNEMRRLNGLP